jgi:nucleotide-binding universal stress UspA family protein
MRKILAAIDSSAAARPVVAMAIALGQTLNASPEAMHVCDDGGQTAFFTAEKFGVEYRTVGGDPFARIAERAAESDVVAVVVGARRRLNARSVGHLARQIADVVEKPVLVVPPEARSAGPIRRVVIAMEGTPAKARNLKVVFDLAAPVDVELVVIHVDDESSVPSFSDQVAHETDAYAREFLARHLPGRPEARLELRVGVPAEEIMELTDSLGADVLAIGWPQLAAADRGATAREILDRSHVPVLLVALAPGDAHTVPEPVSSEFIEEASADRAGNG